MKKTAQQGFTLIELLVVILVVAALAGVLVSIIDPSSFKDKARDAQRKSDLGQIANALEAYYNDHAGYPGADSSGKILACGCEGTGGDDPCNWNEDSGQREFCDENNTVYMTKIPGDPINDPPYYYRSNGTFFQIYAILENNNDPDLFDDPINLGSPPEEYNFGVASTNCKPEIVDPLDPDEGCL